MERLDALADLPGDTDHLLPLQQDVTSTGSVEEAPESGFRGSMEVDFFGSLAVTQAVLPVLRDQGHGHIVQIRSMGGVIALPMAGVYVASSWRWKR